MSDSVQEPFSRLTLQSDDLLCPALFRLRGAVVSACGYEDESELSIAPQRRQTTARSFEKARALWSMFGAAVRCLWCGPVRRAVCMLCGQGWLNSLE
ncbi:MAG: hypothetical protein ACK5LI_13435 [Oleidesulfovibrio sp.]